MGSAGSVLQDEVNKPIDASDVDTPRGVSARAEVARLRKLLSENYEAVSQLLFSHLLSSPRKNEDSDLGQEADAAPNIIEDDMLESAVADLDGIDASDSAAQPIDRPRLSHTSTHRVHESKEDDRATQEDLAALEAELDAEMSRGFEDKEMRDDDFGRSGPYTGCESKSGFGEHQRSGSGLEDSDDDFAQ